MGEHFLVAEEGPLLPVPVKCTSLAEMVLRMVMRVIVVLLLMVMLVVRI